VNGWTDREFAEKVDHEGGIWDALDYGLSADVLADQEGALAQVWRILEGSYDSFKPVIRVLEGQLEALLDADDE
jgi:hypothetical protein